MDSDEQKTPEELGHEPLDVNIGGVTKGVAVLFASIAAALLIVGGILYLLFAVKGQMPTVLGPEARMELPPNVPELDSNQRGSLRELRREESEMLTSYGWVDTQAGIARIPIKRAMEMIIERGLALPEPPVTAGATGNENANP